MKFLHIEAFLLFLPLIGIYFYSKNRDINYFSTNSLQKLSTNSKSYLKNLLLFLSPIFLIIAISRPVIIGDMKPVKSKSRDIVIAIDISGSMSGDDIKPNRLEFAKDKLREILKSLKNSRVAILAFTTNTIILSPLTSDRDILLNVFDSINLDSVITKGTDLMPLLIQTDKLIKSDKKYLIVLSDGGDEYVLTQHIEFAKSKNIEVSIIGIGTKYGSTLRDGNGELLKDSSGNIVVSSINQNIEYLAKLSGGIYVENGGVDDILTHIESFKDREVESVEYEYFELFYLFLIISFISFSLSIFNIKFKNFTILLLFLIIPKANSSIIDFYHIQEFKKSYEKGDYNSSINSLLNIDDSYQKFFNLGNSYYYLREYKKAVESYERVVGGGKDFRAKAFFNMGNSYFKAEKYQEAIESYTKSLILNYDRDCEFNRELAYTKLKNQNKDSEKPKNKNSNKGSIANESSGEGKSNSNLNSGNGESGSGAKEGESEDKDTNKKPLSYKQYQLINQKKGSDEEKPW